MLRFTTLNYYAPIFLVFLWKQGDSNPLFSYVLFFYLTCRMGSEAIQHPETALGSHYQVVCRGKFYDTISDFRKIRTLKRRNL